MMIKPPKTTDIWMKMKINKNTTQRVMAEL